MDFNQMFSLLIKVFTNKAVLTATVAVILYLNFVTYVQHYQKKAPPIRKPLKRKVEAAEAKPAENGESSNSSQDEDVK